MINNLITELILGMCITFSSVNIYGVGCGEKVYNKIEIEDDCEINFLKCEFFKPDGNIAWEREIHEKNDIPSLNMDLKELHDTLPLRGYYIRLKYQLKFSEDTVQVLHYCAFFNND